MATPVPSDKVKDKEYTNWLKVTLAMYYMKSGLHTFIENEVNCLHQSLVHKIHGGQTVPLPPCTMCDARHVKRNKHNGVWEFQKQCKSYCGVWLYKLLKLHTNPKSEKIYWDNSHVPSWPFDSWECAKVFMPRGQQASNAGPTDCDVQALLTLLTSCTHFHPKLSPQGLGLTHIISTIRNKVMHNGEMKLSDADRVSFIQQIMLLLEDPVSLKSLEDCKTAVDNIHKVDNNSVDVFFNVELEMTALRAVVNELRQSLGVQEKKHVDSADSLKEEYTQLKEQLAKKFEDVVKNLELHGDSTTDRFEDVEKKLEMQGERTTDRFEVVEKKLKLQGESTTERFEVVDKKLELQGESTMDRFEVVDKKLDLQGQSTTDRFEVVDKKLELQGQSTTDRFEVVEKRLKLQGESTTDRFEVVDKKSELQGQSTTDRFEVVDKKLELQGQSTTDRFEAVDKKLEFQGESSSRRFEGIEKELELQGERVNAVEENVVKLREEFGQIRREKEISTKKRPESDGLRQLKNQTEDSLDTFRKKGFIPTTQTMEAKKLLQEKRTIVIKGNPGEGKTSTALHLIDTYDYINQRVVVKSPEDWKKVDTDWIKIVVLEDIFGQYDLDPGLLQEWIDKYLQIIQNHVDVGKLEVVITIREDIHLKAYSKLKSFRLFFSDMSLTLSSQNLNNSDKMSILDRVLERNSKVLNVGGKRQCIANFSGLIGFPQCCSLFVVYEDLFDQGPEFFRSPRKFLVDNIRNLNHNSLLSLAFLFCNGEIEAEYLSPSQKESKKYLPLLEDLSLYLNISFNKSTMISLRESYDHYSGLYVSKGFSYEYHSERNVKKSCIQFSHATIYEAVGQVLGDRCPEMVVKYGESGYLYGRTYTAEAKDDTFQNVYMPVSVYGLLAERIIHDVVEKQLVKRVVKHSALQSRRLVRTLKNELLTTNRIKHFLMADLPFQSKDLSEGKCFTFLQYILQNDKDVVSLVYKQFLEFLTCTHNDYSFTCWQCKEKCNLLELALYYHHYEIADKLIAMNAHYTHVCLSNATRHGDHSRVQNILEDLKWSRDFKPECSEAKKALCRAYLSGNQDVIEILLQEGITLDSMHVVNVVQQGDINVLRKVVKHLKYHNKWDPHKERYSKYFQTFVYSDILDLLHGPNCHCPEIVDIPCNYNLLEIAPIPCSLALYITYCNEKFDLADYLVENEVKVSPSMLYYVSAYSSVQAVASVIQNMKVTGTWDPHCHHASKALEKAFSENRDDLRDLLIKERVSLTMKNFPGVVKGVLVSLESVKKALQHLNDTDSWDPKCSYAFQAFRKAYRNQKDDVCNLLVKEGVSLTMRDLSDVIMRSVESSDSVKMIVQHLKDSDHWDPKCADASKALEKAYAEYKYDVCDLLIHEGVSLTMKHLPCMIMRSLDYVETSVKRLKDSNSWDPECTDASKALEKAFGEHRYDLCDLLVQEGVSLTMKNLPCIILRSPDDVKRSVKQLKDTDRWDPTCNYAFEALGKAYGKQKYNVCDLLIQEGVMIIMKNLPFMIQRSLSEDYVKSSVKLLKYRGSWDSKCDYASEALREAYCKQWYDVCDLLVQEGVSMTMKILPYIVLRSLDYMKMAVKHLKDTNSWDPKCDGAVEALEKAYVEKKYHNCDLLIQEGVSLTMKNLLGVIMRGSLVPLESVRKAIQHLKDTGYWDPTCDDGSSTLERVYWAQKYDVYDLLVQEGLSLTMKTLSGVIMKSEISLEFVKKAVQYLQDTGSWDPKCDDASEALEKAYEEKKYGICDLLVQEGVSLTMKHLPYMILRSLDYVKATVKHLKDANSWDPKCDVASKALEMVCWEEKYETFDLLVKEGVSLTMKFFSGFTRFHITLKTVKKAIQHLKDTNNWDPWCDDARETLEKAYEKKMYDICDLLVQKGVPLTMKHLPHMILRSLDYLETSLKHTSCFHKVYFHDRSRTLENVYWRHYLRDGYDAYDLQLLDRVAPLVRNPIRGLQPSSESIEIAVQYLKDSGCWNLKYDYAFKLFTVIYFEKKYVLYNLLVQQGVSLTMKILPDLIMICQISLEIVTTVIQDLKYIDTWDPKCGDASETLVKAYRKKRYDICDLLVQEGVTLTMNKLTGFLSGCQVALESVEKVIHLLKHTGCWDPKSDDALEALEQAYKEKKYGICNLLVQEGVLLTIKPLLHMTVTSLDYVKAGVKHLEDANIWDDRCDDASKALEMDFWEGKYDICDLLIQEGIPLTMKKLPDFMRFGMPFRTVEKLIQYLKDTSSWVPKCDDASEALVKAYGQEMYDICDLLVKEGISLTMMNIFEVLPKCQIPLEAVKKAIQHLKDTNSWDPKCGYAFKTIRMAYGLMRYDICDVLIEDSIPLTMKNLNDDVNKFEIPLEIVMKAIEHLKDNSSWDPKCDDASETLVKAYREERYDICDLLVQEGISLTIKNLSNVLLKNLVSLEAVKKAIQHLKDTNSWDPKCDDAYKTLYKAYVIKRYDICNLLVNEGISLTMKSFSDLLTTNYISLEAVKKAIQYLKDTNSWDPWCDDASETLEKAYGKERYDISDLLVKEGISLTMKNLLVL